MEDTWNIALRFFRACHSYTCIGVSVTNAIPAAIAFTIKAVITLGCRTPLGEFLRNSCVRSIRGCEGTSSLMGLWPVRRRGRASSWPSPRANHPAGPPTPYATCRGCLPVFSRPRAAVRQRAGYPKSSPARRPFRRARAGQPPGATLRFPARQPPRHAQAPTAVTAQTSLPTTAPAAVPSHQPPARGIPADGRAETPCSGHTGNPQCTHCGSHAAMPWPPKVPRRKRR